MLNVELRKSIFIIGLLLFLLLKLSAQDLPLSIHAAQQHYYSRFGARDAGFYDSLNGFSGKLNLPNRSACQLQQVVFGFRSRNSTWK